MLISKLYIIDKNAYLKDNDDISSNSKSIQNNENRMDEITVGSSKAVRICDDINEYELDDDWDSDVEITDINNFEFTGVSSDTESEVESNESQFLSKKYFKQDIANPALTYMEYSGLTEKQILSLLEKNNREANKSVKNVSKMPQVDSLKAERSENKSNSLNIDHLISISENSKEETNKGDENISKIPQVDSLEAEQSENKSNSLNVEHLISASENNTKDTEHDSTNVKSIDASRSKLCESNTDTNVPSIKAANISNKTQVESKNTTIVSSTDSDTDDFLEIEDVPIPNIANATNKYVPQNIQITFKSDEKVEDDMFADVFETHDSELNADSVPSSKIFYDQEMSENKQTSKETVADSIKDQVNDKKLFNLRETNDINVPSVDVDSDILNTNVPLPEESQMRNEINIENITLSLKDTIETANIKDNTSINGVTGQTKRISPIPMNEDELLSLQVRT